MAVTWLPRRRGHTSALRGAQGRRAAGPKAGSATAPVTLGQPRPEANPRVAGLRRARLVRFRALVPGRPG